MTNEEREAFQAQALEHAREVRADIFDLMVEVEIRLASPVSVDHTKWTGELEKSMLELSEAFREHRDATEGPNALFDAIILECPRIASRVQRLVTDHRSIEAAIDALLEAFADPDCEPEVIRVEATELLGLLARHRQRGADVVYEVYDVDIGGHD